MVEAGVDTVVMEVSSQALKMHRSQGFLVVNVGYETTEVSILSLGGIVLSKLIKIGVNVEEFDDAVRVWTSRPLVKTNIKTSPHPGFPTDMQPQIAAILTMADGTSIVNEAVWDNRFRYVEELRRMGAEISVDGKLAVIEGVEQLKGAPVKATDLRAGAAMIIAALGAKGKTQIEDIRHIERGYEDVVEKFAAIGADIKKVRSDDPTVKTA